MDKTLFQNVVTFKSKKRKSKKEARKLSYDALEQRHMLTIFVVDSIADDNSGAMDGSLTLREAIIAAETNMAFGDAAAGDADGDIIRFDSALDGQAITLANGEFSITDDLAIFGGNIDISIDAASASRIFNVNSMEQIVLRDLTLTNGQSSDDGGAISIAGAGQTTINSLFITGSESTGSGGGGIAVTDNSLLILNSDISGNDALGTSGSGGGILILSGDTRIVNTVLAANVANRAGGGIEIVDGSLELIDSTLGGPDALLGNIAGPMGTAAPGNGGGLHVTGNATNIRIFGGTVQNNIAAREGGGLWNQSGSTMNVRDAMISDNQALGDAADDGGGGIFNNGGTTRLRFTTLNHNHAIGVSGSGGGAFSTDGLLSIINSVVSANIANRAGGGIEIVDGTFFVAHSTLGGLDSADGNIAGPAGSAAPGNGGGLHVTGTDGTNSRIVSSIVSNNVAAREGGGLWNQSGSILRVVDSDIVDNIASGDAADDGGGGIFNNGGTTRLRDVLVHGNIASGTSGSGGGLFSTDGLVSVRNSVISANVANRAGGGIEIVDGTISIRNSLLGGSNLEDGNVAGPDGTAAPGNGGGLHVTGTAGTVTQIVGGRVENNSAASEGGGLWNQSGSFMVIEGTTISNNVASGDAADNGGGGIFNNGGNINVDDVTIIGNDSDGIAGSGGGVFSTDGTFRVLNSTVTENSANRAGGGIEIVDGVFEMINSVLSHNVAGGADANPGNGGGLHVTGINGTVSMFDNTVVIGNSASDEGGGLWNQAGSFLSVTNGSVISGNNSGVGGGGGIFNNGGMATIADTIIISNSSLGNGGGINAQFGSVTNVTGSVISFNDAANGGGFFNSDSSNVLNTVFTFNTARVDGGGVFTDLTGVTTLVDSILANNTPNEEN